MTVMQFCSEQTDLHHAINEIQSEWSMRERARRSRLADLRQRRLARMLSPLPRVEAYDCQCDMGDGFNLDDSSGPDEAHRSHRYVLIED